MNRIPTITGVRSVIVNVSPRTNWVFVLVDTDDGRSGLGEATLDGHEAQVLAELSSAERTVMGQPAVPMPRTRRPHPAAFGGLAHAAALSGLEQAMWDLHGQRLDAPVVDLLGGSPDDGVRAYANINRGILGDRSPDAFAEAARGAVAAGFDAVKIAPFDGLRWQPEQDRAASVLIEAGLDRARAVRDAVGPDVDVLIDCHGRFNARTAAVVIPRIEAIAPYWIEDPVPERDLEGWRRVRDGTTARLAGGEFLVGLEAYRRFIAAAGVDVVIADVKYCGGIAALQRVAAVAESFGIVLSPHNPSGPVATAATAHVALASAAIPIVEYAWGEASWRSDLVAGDERVEGGRIVVGRRPGLGVRLDETICALHPFVVTPISPDLWER